MGLFKVVILISILITLYFVIQRRNENFDNSRIYFSRWPADYAGGEFNEKQELGKIEYIYGEKPIETQFKKEQEIGIEGSRIIYPNKYVERINKDTQEPIFSSDFRGTPYPESDEVEGFIESKARFNYEMYQPRTIRMGGISDPTDFHEGQAPTLKEIYDKQFVDFKQLQPKKTMIDDKQNNIQEGASNLSYVLPDTWIYDNEKIENGGAIVDNLYANDPSVIGSVATF